MSNWQPIETAPKDGTIVRLGWLPNGILEYEALASWQRNHWSEGWTPTHWMPAIRALKEQKEETSAR